MSTLWQDRRWDNLVIPEEEIPPYDDHLAHYALPDHVDIGILERTLNSKLWPYEIRNGGNGITANTLVVRHTYDRRPDGLLKLMEEKIGYVPVSFRTEPLWLVRQ